MIINTKREIEKDSQSMMIGVFLIILLTNFILLLINPELKILEYSKTIIVFYFLAVLHMSVQNSIIKWSTNINKSMNLFIWFKSFSFLFGFLIFFNFEFGSFTIQEAYVEKTKLLSNILLAIGLSGLLDDFLQLFFKYILLFLRSKNIIITTLIITNAITLGFLNKEDIINYKNNVKLTKETEKPEKQIIENETIKIEPEQEKIVKPRKIKNFLKNGRFVLAINEVDYNQSEDYKRFLALRTENILKDFDYKNNPHLKSINYYKTETSYDIGGYLIKNPNDLKSIDFPSNYFRNEIEMYSFKYCKLSSQIESTLIYDCNQYINLKNGVGEPSDSNNIIIKILNNKINIRISNDKIYQHFIINELGDMIAFTI